MRTDGNKRPKAASIIDNVNVNNRKILSAIKNTDEEVKVSKKYLRLKIGMISGQTFEFEVPREDKYLVEQALKHGDIHEFKLYGVGKEQPGVVVKLEYHEYYTWF